MNDRKSFNFYLSHWQQIKKVSDEQKLRLFNAICEVQFMDTHIYDIRFDDDVLLDLLWDGIKHSLETSINGFISKQESLGKAVNYPLYTTLGKGLNKGGLEGGENTLGNNVKEKEKDNKKAQQWESIAKAKQQELLNFFNEYCAKESIDTQEVDKFTNYNISKGSKYKDWKAAFRNWIINAKKWSKPANNTSKLSESEFDRLNGFS